MCAMDKGDLANKKRDVNLNFTNQIYTWLQCFAAFLPFCGTYFTVVRSYELRSFHLTEEFVGITSDVIVLYFGNLDFCLRGSRQMCRGKPYLLLQSLHRMHESARL